MMKSQSAVVVNEIQKRMDGIKELTEEYLNSHFGEDMETFNRQWNHPDVKPLDISLVWNFQDRPDITRSEYTGRVQQVFVPFNRILYHLGNITEHAKTSANTIQSTDKQAVASIRSGIKKRLNSVLCPMYQYLAMADRDLHIETAQEIDQHAHNSISLEEEVECGLLFVYLTKTMDWFFISSQLFANS
ncbi:uncharacterized protein LOC120422613 [Culex pipiens pallens]|uniref:uncharacterized protein LOC120422613 n=1 Tax=Culex pipiens pallens TaxID=42434 RepID=UPI0019546103|nr:uncharacterized protein LOC120422613 [Culex pipiens pallens]